MSAKEMNKLKKISGVSRRKFLGQASCAALGYASLYSSLINLKALNASAISNLLSGSGGDDYKALVCVFLSGGSDSFNVLVPSGDPEYQEYATVRSNLAIPQNDLLPLDLQVSDGRDFGLHPVLGGLQNVFNNQRAAFISNVGTLIEPTPKENVWNGVAPLPLGLFSHADQIQQWQTGMPHVRASKGWGGRVADLVHSQNQNQNISMNISLSGTNVFQLGNNTIEYTIDPFDGSTGIYGYDRNHPEWDYFNILRTQAIDSLLDHQYQDIFKRTYTDVVRNSRDAHVQFQEALSAVGEFNTSFADNYISRAFRMIARTIAAKDDLGMKRQIFFLNFGGWDHHDELLQNQQEMLAVLGTAIGEFAQVLEEINLSDCVTTFSISEFGRTLTSNGNGTDHAWGGNVFVMGGAVNGGRIFGDYPVLALDSGQEIGNGVFVPTTSADQYFAELALWFGVSPGQLDDIFPNLSNFYDTQSSEPPLGFLNL
jgi:uncharacterized protein (DUF1501 family)